jgi:SAM-dependent methyltransferase
MENLGEVISRAIKIYESGGNVSLELNDVNIQKIIEISYSLQSGSYIDSVLSQPETYDKYTSQIAQIIDQYIAPYETILDIGTGELTTLSLVLDKLETPLAKVLACDISWSRLFVGQQFAQSLKLNSKIDLFCADMIKLPLADNSIDTIISCHALEPNRTSEAKIVSELFRVARKRLILFEPSYEENSPEGIRRMDKLNYIRGLKQMLVDNGGRIVLFKPIFSLNDLNPTYCHVVDLKKNLIGDGAISEFTVPGSNYPLNKLSESFLISKNLGIVFPIFENIPILQERNFILASKFKV